MKHELKTLGTGPVKKMKTTTQGTKEWASYNANYSKRCTNNCFGYCYSCAMAERYNQIVDRTEWKDMINKDFISITGTNQEGKKISSKRTDRLYDGLIMTPTSHDIVPMNLHLAKKYYLELLEAGNTLLIVTKPNPKIIKELALYLRDYKDKIIWRLSITNLNQELRKKWECGASAWWHRIEILQWLFENGFQTSVSIEPFLENPVPIVKKVLPYVTEKIWVGPMNKMHVLKDYWTTIEKLYEPKNLLLIKQELDTLHDDKIVFKDTFINNLPVQSKNKNLQDYIR